MTALPAPRAVPGCRCGCYVVLEILGQTKHAGSAVCCSWLSPELWEAAPGPLREVVLGIAGYQAAVGTGCGPGRPSPGSVQPGPCFLSVAQGISTSSVQCCNFSF